MGLADQEAKINLLRDRAKTKRPYTEIDDAPDDTPKQPSPTAATSAPLEHVNFFNDLEAGKYVSTKVNEEHVKEKKDEQEKYEKQIGYLTYLGQDTNEATGKRDWYDQAPKNRTDTFDESGNKVEVSLKSKLLLDPIRVIERYIGRSIKTAPSTSKTESRQLKYDPIIDTNFKESRKRQRSRSPSGSSSKKSKKKKHKKDKKKCKKSKHHSRSQSSESSDDEERRILQKQKLEKLRAERLQREKVERARADQLLAKLRGDSDPTEKPKEVKLPNQPPPVKQKYNSQFNPEIARQNFD